MVTDGADCDGNVIIGPILPLCGEVYLAEMEFITVETHCHTYRSGDCLMKPLRLIKLCRARGIQRLCITDHNTARGALEMATIAPDLVIPGEEIMTSQGELLALFVDREVPPGLEPMETIERLRGQGAVIAIPHPFDHHRGGGWCEKNLRAVLPFVDAVETFNARSLLSGMNERAAALAREVGLAAIVGSDAHSYAEVGRTTMRMPAYDGPEQFLANLSMAELRPRRSSGLVHLASRWAALVHRCS